MTAQQLPEGWQMVKFGDIAKHISKRVEPSETELNIYVGLEHLDPDSLKIKRHGIPSDVAGQKLLVKKGQIIFGKRRAYQRKVAVAGWDCICSAHAMVLEAIPDKIIPEFLPFFMQSDVFMRRAVAVSEGSLSPTIKWKILAMQEFRIPSLAKQREVLYILKKASDSLTYTEALENSFSKLSDVVVTKKICQFGFSEVSIEELIKSGDILEIQDGNHGNDHPKASDYVVEGIPFVMASDIVNGTVDVVGCKKLAKPLADKLRIGFSRPGDILLSHKGTVGLVAITPAVPDYIMLTPQVTYYRVKDGGRLKQKFLEIYFRSQYFQRSLKVLSAQSTRAYIGITAQKKIKVPLLSGCQQDQIISLWQQLEETKLRIRTKRSAACKLSESIINRG